MAGEQIAAKYENWLRLMTLIHYVGFEICRNILHNIENLPVNGTQLYLALFRQQREFNRLLRKKVLSQSQFDLIFPANGATDIKEFDITLFTCVITVMFGKQKYKQAVGELKKWRNEEFHQGEILMNNLEFNNKWNGLLLLAAGYGVNAGNFADLKTCAMDKISQHNNRFVYSEILKTKIEQKRQNGIIRKVIVGGFVLAIFLISIVVYFAYFQNKSEPLSISLERRFNSSSEMLKKNYVQTIGQQNLKSIHETYRPKKRFYVDLAIVPKNNSVENLATISRQFFVFNQLNQNGTVTINQLLNAHKDNNMVLIQGPGGVGKSFTLETAALHWAEGKIWSDVKFVFLLKFRELNLFVGKSFKGSLCKIYEQVFKGLKFEDLENVSEKIVFLMDGIDEFSGLNETLSQEPYGNDISVASGLYKLLKSNYFPGRHLIMTGRAFSCEQIKMKFKELSIESYNVLGFSSPQVKSYIETYFEPNQTKAGQLINTIKQQSNLDLMSRTPAFLWSLCELHQQTNAFQGIQTVTPLFTLQLTLFFQHHLHNLNLTFSQTNSIEIYKVPAVQKLVGELSKIAKMTLEEGVVLIDIKEFKNSATINLLENSGFINRVKTTFGEKIQFHHMLMQEFLTAIFFLRSSNSNSQELLNEDKYSGVASLYAGLSGGCLKDSNSSNHVRAFVDVLNLCPKTDVFKRSFADQSIGRANFIEILYEYQNNLDPPMLGVCPHSVMKYEIQHLSFLYQSKLKNVPFGHYWNESLLSMSCKSVPNFYIFNSLLEKCDIRKFENVTKYIKECDLKNTSDVRHHLLKFPYDFHRFKRSFSQLKNFCTQTMPKFRELQKIPLMSGCKPVFYAYRYFVDKVCRIDFLEKLNHVMKKIKVWRFNHGIAVTSEMCNSFASERAAIINIYSHTMQVLKNVDFKPCLEKSFGITNNITSCSGESVLPCLDYFKLFHTFDILENAGSYETRVNQSVTERCSSPINFCGSLIYISQKNKDQSISQITYFFRKFGSVFRNRVSLLEFDNLKHSDDIQDVLPHLCNLKFLYLFKSYTYDVKSLTMLITTLENCSVSTLDIILLDFYLHNRESDYVKANEMALKKIYTTEELILRVHSNVGRSTKLLRDNILSNHALPNFRLRAIRFVMGYLNAHYCKYFSDIMHYVAILEVTPFDDLLFDSKQVDGCKDVILKQLNKKISTTLETFNLQEWKLVLGKGYYYWMFDKDFDLNGRSEMVLDEKIFLPIVVYILANLSLCFFALASFFFIYLEDYFDIFGDFEIMEDGISYVLKIFYKRCHLAIALFLFVVFFTCLIELHWIPGEKLFHYQDPLMVSTLMG